MTRTPTDGPPSSASSSASPDPSDTVPGQLDVASEPTRLDRYVLLERIGQGSFASVWAAYDPQLDRRVAIKLLQRNSSSGAQLSEAQALAKLSHPHVVAVHDVQPYHAVEPGGGSGLFIVMEFLAGASLREWMEQPHDWREVVGVFIEAGRGLAAAHERGLVHRDFKPSNVMFGADERVRVLDFGLASSTDEQQSEPDREPRIAGTPAYMAPEQHLGEPVDPRSDQYAFCVALYEVLYGQRPFVGRNLELLGQAKLQANIRPPPRSSSVPAWLHAVVVRGLAVDRDARWPDMDALLDALASDPSLVRRRWAIASALTLALAAAALGVARFGADDRSTSELCASPERELAGVWDDAARAEIRERFAATELPYADQAYSRIERALDAHTQEWVQVHREVCEATMVRNEQPPAVKAEQTLCLQRRLRRVGGLVTTLARADASSIARVGDVVLTLESPASCRRDVVEQREQTLDPARRDGVLALESEIARAGVLTQLGRYEEAVAAAQGAIDRALELADADAAGRASLAQTRALWYLGRYDEAIAASEQAMRWAARAGDEETLAMAQIRLIRTYTSMGELEVAEAVARLVAVQIADGRLGRELEAWYDFYVAILYTKQVRWAEAIARLEHGLALREQLFGPEHPELAPLHNTWGNALFRQRDYDGALEHYREALRLWERNFGPEYPDVASVNNNIGAIHLSRGEYELARPYFERVLASYELSLGPDHPQVGGTLGNLGTVSERKGRLRDALALYERARAITEKRLGDDNVSTAKFDVSIAKVLVELDEADRAEPMAARALEIQHRDVPDDLALINFSTEVLAECQLARGDRVAWRATLERLLEQLDGLELDGPETALPLFVRAQLARDAGDSATALELAELHMAALTDALGPKNENIARRLGLLLELLIDAGEHEAAATRAREALAVTCLDSTDRRRWELEYLLGRAEAGRGDRAAAIAALQRALEFCSGPSGNPSRAALVREQLDALQ